MTRSLSLQQSNTLMRTEKPSRTYIIRYGSYGFTNDDMYYDEEEFTLYEGDTCPQCKEGKLKVSQRNKLYCSELCWLPKPESRHNETLNTAFDEGEDLHFDALNDEEFQY